MSKNEHLSTMGRATGGGTTMTGDVAALPTEAQLDARMATEIRAAVTTLCDKLNEAKRRGIKVIFSIDSPNADAPMAVTRLEINKGL